MNGTETAPAAAERPVVLVGIVSALAIFGDAMLYVVLPVYWQEVGLTALWQVGVLLSVNRFVRLPLNPLLGWLYNKIPLRAGLLLAVILGAASTAGYGLWKGFAAWIVLRSIWGMAWSLLRIGAYLTVISCSEASGSGRMMGRYNGLWRFGSLIGVLFGGFLTPVLGIKAVAVSFGVLALLGIPIIVFYLSADKWPQAVDTNTFSKLGGTKWTKPVVKIVLCGLAVSLLLAVFGSTLTLVINMNYSQSVAVFGILLTSTALGGVLQAVRSAWEPFLATWFGRQSDGPKGRVPLFLISLACAAAGYALLPWTMPIYVWIAIVLLVMAASTSLSTVMDAMASDAARTSSVIAVMTAYSVSTDLGAAAGPVLTYWAVGSELGLIWIYTLCAAVFLLIGLWYRKDAARRSQAVIHST